MSNRASSHRCGVISLAILSVIGAGAATCAPPKPPPPRQVRGPIVRNYRAGAVLRYQLRLRRFLADELVAHWGATTEHRVAPTQETVTWTSLVDHRDGTEHTARARAFGSFLLSQVATSATTPRPTTDAVLAGLRADLRTIWAAASPRAGVPRLLRPGDRARGRAPHRRDWSAGSTPRLAQSCGELRVRWVSRLPHRLHLRTALHPPLTRCLAPRFAWMKNPVAGAQPRNVQRVSAGPGGLEVYWGTERIQIDTMIDPRRGGIRKATLVVRRRLQGRRCPSPAGTACAPLRAPPERRELTLTPLP